MVSTRNEWFRNMQWNMGIYSRPLRNLQQPSALAPGCFGMRRTRARSWTTYTKTARTTVRSWAVAWLPGPPWAARDAASAAPRNLVLSALMWLSGIWEPFFVQFHCTVVAPLTHQVFGDEEKYSYLHNVNQSINYNKLEQYRSSRVSGLFQTGYQPIIQYLWQVR